jgi:hypothetical protein
LADLRGRLSGDRLRRSLKETPSGSRKKVGEEASTLRSEKLTVSWSHAPKGGAWRFTFKFAIFIDCQIIRIFKMEVKDENENNDFAPHPKSGLTV